MTELTRLLDLLRDKPRAYFWLRMEDGGQGWLATATFTADGWQVFSASGKPTPEAAVADLVLQLADWESKRAQPVRIPNVRPARRCGQ